MLTPSDKNHLRIIISSFFLLILFVDVSAQTHQCGFNHYMAQRYEQDPSLLEIFQSQKKEANSQFSRFIKSEYPSWMLGENPPILSHQLFQKGVLPNLTKDQPSLLLVIDNLRWDQWQIIAKTISSIYTIEREEAYFSILPTATAYARNAFFSGLTPYAVSYTHLTLPTNREV